MRAHSPRGVDGRCFRGLCGRHVVPKGKFIHCIEALSQAQRGQQHLVIADKMSWPLALYTEGYSYVQRPVANVLRYHKMNY